MYGAKIKTSYIMLYIYIHIYTYVYKYVHIHTYVYIYINTELLRISQLLNETPNLPTKGAESLPLGSALYFTFGESSSGTGQNTKHSRNLSGFRKRGVGDLNQA